MTKVLQFSGIDISKNSFDVCIELHGQFKSKKFDYTEEGMNRCVSFLPPVHTIAGWPIFYTQEASG